MILVIMRVRCKLLAKVYVSKDNGHWKLGVPIHIESLLYPHSNIIYATLSISPYVVLSTMIHINPLIQLFSI